MTAIAAKQAAFEEQNRIRNQFRALDDDEIDFLDGMLDERRIEEERIKRETAERLASFREAQKATGVAEDAGDTNDDGAVVVAWGGAGKKRKRSEKDVKSIVKGVRRRTSELEKEADASTKVEAAVPQQTAPASRLKEIEAKAATTSAVKTDASSMSKAADQAKPSTQEKPKLGLVDYGSDEDD